MLTIISPPFLADNYSGFPPKPLCDHISWESTFIASLVKISRKPVQLVCVTDSRSRIHTETNWLYNLSNAANVLCR